MENSGFMRPMNATIASKKTMTDLTTSSNGNPKTHSTPFHENPLQAQTNSGASIHEYFTSPNSTNIIDCNTSANRNIPILGNNINISNTSTNGQDIISYQRVKKIILDNAKMNEEQLKVKENMLQHLKSIDLSKFSFPNENKPKTDYTYAKSSSYLKECKDLANDNVEMPNLCRRARRSPQSLASNMPSMNNSTMLNQLQQQQQEQQQQQQQQAEDEPEQITEIQQRLTLYQKIKTLFNKNSNLSLAETKQLPLGIRLERNLGKELEENEINIQRSQQGTSSRIVTEIDTTTSVTNIITKKNNGQIPSEHGKKSKSFLFSCCGLPLLILILLIPFLIYGLNKIDEQEHIYEHLNENYIKKYFDVGLNQEMINNFKTETKKYIDLSCRFLFFYLPSLVKNQTQFIHSKTTSYFNEIIDYKPPTIGDFDLTNKLLTSKEENFVKTINEIKEKVLQETLSSFKDSKFLDVDLIKKELDQKFNYTLTIVSNQLADQLSQFELSKNEYENELKKVKTVLNELDSRYSQLILQLQEQKKLNEQLKLIQTKTEVDEKVKETFSGEYVSFKKIEEYINRTFYLYNADKTGMTDFASETIGGSIMFTRCTEDYLDNSKWFTVFDVPITRIPVSPRVVIQGSIQPGNCWAFKGSKADLFIKLAARIAPTSFSLEHIPKELSLTGNIDSAPQNFSVYGYTNKDDISDDTRLLLGNYRYDNESKNTLQFFSVQNQHPNKPISVIELKIESNAGNKDYTCLYKFRVHGKLFKSEQQQANENEPNKAQFKNEFDKEQQETSQNLG